MTEKLLQYLWNYKVFKYFDFKDIEGNSVEIIQFGKWNKDAGPDFLDSKIKINGVILAGNIELHIRSSDWIFHNHSQDPNYQNIILHVVFQHDIEISMLTQQKVPTLELKHYIDENIVWKYERLINGNQFIACENIFDKDKIPVNFHEGNILKKLEEKSIELEQNLILYKNNFEAVLFHSLAYSFGLKVNAHIFKQISESVDYSIINKIRQNPLQLEALLFGISGWLTTPVDGQMKIWKREFDFLKAKFKISDLIFHPKFLRLRPPNFPTIRLSQLANLYQHQNLFSKVMDAESIEELYDLFKSVKASEYWDCHFNFGTISKVQPKALSKDFIDIIILNTILPLQYTYHKYHSEEIVDKIIGFYQNITAEKNSVIQNWKNLGVPITNALESQSLIYHYKNSCAEKNCLTCSIGFKLLKES
ncbi:DUF2851 family protein [Chryseobacterium jejuense]|uniref:Protein of uncharacterized function (DUF2851) n=1 Tax=Chryseobacterium jejuense TaxID=445960 RepID=A0A2X2XFN6_CHRJE|nr:DUF2851 family protein [Chryseobacterium jejuense]SDJ86629.1 Protein of unknown function [Chryseobacterium jejuense]SQB46865.1 Protein of uncharacterised function (DUF2851) [Chryseobacterium jejuense]